MGSAKVRGNTCVAGIEGLGQFQGKYDLGAARRPDSNRLHDS